MPTIKQLLQNKQIRTWSYTVCTDNGINSTDELIAYFKENGSFMALKNCGLLVNNELKEVCEYYSLLALSDSENSDKPLKYANLDSGKRAMELGHIDVLVVVSDKIGSLAPNVTHLQGRVGWCVEHGGMRSAFSA